MCEIRVKNGLVPPARPPVFNEQGRGYILVYRKHIRCVSGLDGEKVSTKVAHLARPCFSVIHQRQPSVGTVDVRNVQPFYNERAAFCHNGTLDPELIAFLRSALNAEEWESDSRLLWQMLGRLYQHQKKPCVETLKALAKAGHHRFVWADMETRFVYLIGRWSYRPDEKTWDRYCPGMETYNFVILDPDPSGLGFFIAAAHKEEKPPQPTPTWSWLPKRVWDL
jgi:hypothetical protein